MVYLCALRHGRIPHPVRPTLPTASLSCYWYCIPSTASAATGLRTPPHHGYVPLVLVVLLSHILVYICSETYAGWIHGYHVLLRMLRYLCFCEYLWYWVCLGIPYLDTSYLVVHLLWSYGHHAMLRCYTTSSVVVPLVRGMSGYPYWYQL